MSDTERADRRRGEPIFDLPSVIVVLIAVMGLITLARTMISPVADLRLIADFAFIPDRLIFEGGAPAYPGGWGAVVWSFLTYAFLHDGWVHFGLNAAMLAAIGRVVVARIGTVRFLAFFVFVAIAGAFAQLLFDWGGSIPTIGASGAVMGLLGGLLRFVYVPAWSPPMSVVECLRTPRVQSMIGALVVMNVILVVMGTAPFGGSGGGIAWTVHLGGFVAGLLCFAAFDRPGLRQKGSRW